MAFAVAPMGFDSLDTGGVMPVYGRLARAALYSRRHAESNTVLAALDASRLDEADASHHSHHDGDTGGVGARWLAESAQAAARNIAAAAAAAPPGDVIVIPVAPQQSSASRLRAHHLQQHQQQLQNHLHTQNQQHQQSSSTGTQHQQPQQQQQQQHRHHHASRSKQVEADDKSRGPAFEHLLQQSTNLMKRLKDAHSHLAKAFDHSAGATVGLGCPLSLSVQG
jgi:hypothetical protein